MQAGIITMDGKNIGVIEIALKGEEDFTPDTSGYVPEGRAEAGLSEDYRAESQSNHSGGGGHRSGKHRSSGGSGARPQGGAERPSRQRRNRDNDHRNSAGYSQENDEEPRFGPSGRSYDGGESRGRPVNQGTEEVDAAIQRAARHAGIDPNSMRAYASIESAMNPSSNHNRSTQYKGLYQIGRDEWQRFGQGNIYSAEDNAMGAARLFRENSRQFENKFGRKPNDTELYMMHQQGLGFYTRGAMTNIAGNPYPGMRGPQTSESFEAGWGREINRRKKAFERVHSPQTAAPSNTIPQTTSNPPVLKMPDDL